MDSSPRMLMAAATGADMFMRLMYGVGVAATVVMELHGPRPIAGDPLRPGFNSLHPARACAFCGLIDAKWGIDNNNVVSYYD